MAISLRQAAKVGIAFPKLCLGLVERAMAGQGP